MLTKERLAQLFPDNFQLANYAIQKAQKQIQSGTYPVCLNDLLEKICSKKEKYLERLEKLKKEE